VRNIISLQRGGASGSDNYLLHARERQTTGDLKVSLNLEFPSAESPPFLSCHLQAPSVDTIIRSTWLSCREGLDVDERSSVGRCSVRPKRQNLDASGHRLRGPWGRGGRSSRRWL